MDSETQKLIDEFNFHIDNLKRSYKNLIPNVNYTQRQQDNILQYIDHVKARIERIGEMNR